VKFLADMANVPDSQDAISEVQRIVVDLGAPRDPAELSRRGPQMLVPILKSLFHRLQARHSSVLPLMTSDHWNLVRMVESKQAELFEAASDPDQDRARLLLAEMVRQDSNTIALVLVGLLRRGEQNP
jgi:hypothetical protein